LSLELYFFTQAAILVTKFATDGIEKLSHNIFSLTIGPIQFNSVSVAYGKVKKWLFGAACPDVLREKR